MSVKTVVMLATIVIIAICSMQAVVRSEKSEPGVYAASEGNTGLISAPIIYGDTMLVVVTDAGVAAIRFAVKDANLINSSARYSYRYLKDKDSKEIAGEGKLWDTVNDIDKLTIKAGPIRIGWRQSRVGLLQARRGVDLRC